MHHRHDVRRTKHDLHVVLAEQQSESLSGNHALHELHRALGFVWRHARGRLIQQEQARAQGERDGQLERSLIAVGEKACRYRRVLREADRLEESHGLVLEHFVRDAKGTLCHTAVGQHRVLQVLLHRQLPKDVGDLHGARDPSIRSNATPSLSSTLRSPARNDIKRRMPSIAEPNPPGATSTTPRTIAPSTMSKCAGKWRPTVLDSTV